MAIPALQRRTFKTWRQIQVFAPDWCQPTSQRPECVLSGLAERLTPRSETSKSAPRASRASPSARHRPGAPPRAGGRLRGGSEGRLGVHCRMALRQRGVPRVKALPGLGDRLVYSFLASICNH